MSTTELEEKQNALGCICADERKTRADGYTQHSEGISRVQRRFDGACNEFKNGGLKKKRKTLAQYRGGASGLYGYRRSHHLLPSSNLGSNYMSENQKSRIRSEKHFGWNIVILSYSSFFITQGFTPNVDF
jgi:hypothetical protein